MVEDAHGNALTLMSKEEMYDEITRLQSQNKSLEALLLEDGVKPISNILKEITKYVQPRIQEVARLARVMEHSPEVPQLITRYITWQNKISDDLEQYIDFEEDFFQTVDRSSIFGKEFFMKTISFINLKGGVGKTFLSTNSAFCVSAMIPGIKILFIDNDKQGNASNWFDAKMGHGTITNLLMGDASAEEVIQPTRYENIDIISADMGLISANSSILQAEEIDQTKILKEALAPVQDKYDICIIDNPPDINISVLNALVVTDDVVIVTFPDNDSMSGVQEMLKQIEMIKSELNPELNLKGILVNAFFSYSPVYTALNALKSEHIPVFRTKIHYASKTAKNHMQIARQERKSIFEQSPGCQISRDIYSFVKEFLGIKD